MLHLVLKPSFAGYLDCYPYELVIFLFYRTTHIQTVMPQYIGKGYCARLRFELLISIFGDIIPHTTKPPNHKLTYCKLKHIINQ